MRAPAAAALAGFFFLGLYLAFPDKVFVFDGVMFAGHIERSGGEWRQELFNRRHLLFNPALMLLRDSLGALGLAVPGYELMQRCNAFLGLAGLWCFYRLNLRLTQDQALSWTGAAVLGASLCYWSRASEGQVYMAMTIGALAAVWAAVALAQEPRPRHAAALALCLALAVLFHAANIALLPMALAAAWSASGRMRPAALWSAAALAAAAVTIPYCAAFGLRDLASLSAFLEKATEFDIHGQTSLGQAFLARLWSMGGGGLEALGQLGQALAVMPGPGAAAAGAALLGLGVWAFAACRRRPKTRPAAWVLACWGLAFAVLDLLWHGGEFFWAAPLAAVLSLAAAALPGSARRRALLAGGAAAALGLCAWNLQAGIRPRARIGNNVGYGRALFVRDHTVASSWVITSGFGFPNAKVYLPHFAQRTRDVLEYHFIGRSKAEGLAHLAAFVADKTAHGVPLYLLSDVVDDPAAQQALLQALNVSPQDVRQAFGPGEVLPVAAQDPGLRVFLFIPKGRETRLFAGLSYSLLTDDSPTRLAETASALKALAGTMTPARKREAAKLLEDSEYGIRLLHESFYPSLGPEARRAAQARIQGFREWRKTADFHLRLGNIMRYLGAEDEVRRAWAEAYRISRDPELAKDLARLGAQP